MRISDWSSDVCSSDLAPFGEQAVGRHAHAFRRGVGKPDRAHVAGCALERAAGTAEFFPAGPPAGRVESGQALARAQHAPAPEALHALDPKSAESGTTESQLGYLEFKHIPNNQTTQRIT